MRIQILIVSIGLWFCCSQAHSGQFAWDYNSWKKNAMGCVQLPSEKEVKKRRDEVLEYRDRYYAILFAPIETLSQATIDDAVSTMISALTEAQIGIQWLQCFSKKPAYVQRYNDLLEGQIEDWEKYGKKRSQELRALQAAISLFKSFNIPDDILARWLEAKDNDQVFIEKLKRINPRVDVEALRPVMQQAIDKGLRPNTAREAEEEGKKRKIAEGKEQKRLLFEKMEKGGLSLDALPHDWTPARKVSFFEEELIPYWDAKGVDIGDHRFIEAVNESLRAFKAWDSVAKGFDQRRPEDPRFDPLRNFDRQAIRKGIEVSALGKYFQRVEQGIIDTIDPSTLEDAPKLVATLKHIFELRKGFPAKRLLEQAEAFELLRRTGKAGDFPFQELWRFHIDGDRQAQGPYAFDDERNYSLNSLMGLQMVLDPNSSFSAKFYIALHDKMMQGISEPGLSTGGQMFVLEPHDQDHSGLHDIQKRGTSERPPFLYLKERNAVMAREASEKERLTELNELFDKHDAYVQKNAESTKRLMAHLWLARELELRHFFGDGNGRSSNILLVGLIAKDTSLPMLMFEDPNVLDANGPEKLAYRALQGMDNFQKHGMARTYKLSKDTLKLEDLHFKDQKLETLRKDLKKLTEGKDWDVFHRAIENV